MSVKVFSVSGLVVNSDLHKIFPKLFRFENLMTEYERKHKILADLKYTYCGIVDIEYTDTKTVYGLIVNANELRLEELSVKLENYLIESKASWLKAHFSFVYYSIFDSNEFKDDLKVEEIKIWDYIIKWRIAQNPTLSTNSKEWSKENFQTLRITLQQCLPLIRYFHIPVNDKVHVAELSSWIDRNVFSFSNIPYEFQLILRGSRDGFRPKTFWEICNGHAAQYDIK
ncbi:hypothetical protein Glove_300g127 [Diversispora epigaea]|uniref:BACK domain-containing protein n=1 Tax=Diversispora epigaea TaxID=1348612 RepID=A0A397HXT5_9GLOM|nr:hypothetical protein Glove_300g127 [Diversispora epigaea]